MIPRFVRVTFLKIPPGTPNIAFFVHWTSSSSRNAPSGLPLREFAVNHFELFTQLTIFLLQLLDTLPERRNDRGFRIVGRTRLTRSERRQSATRPQLLNPGLERRLPIEPGRRDGCRSRHRAEIDRLLLREERLNGALGAFKSRLTPRLRMPLKSLRVAWMGHVFSLV